MAIERQITCINKNDRYSPYERIHYVGGPGWMKEQVSTVIRQIENGTYSYHTLVNGHKQRVVVARRNGTKYIKTEADSDTPDNLLSLSECR